ncbi:MAG: chromosomal replication initiator protein DnaA [Myxococcota bacterium]|jgi:chromosomal replication initiator protein|nr:chromosomal replication initiator protein DnaA [Myxococcota bacterium]
MKQWASALEWIESRLNPQTFERWFGAVVWGGFDGSMLTLKVPNKFFKEWLSNNYCDLIEDAMARQCGSRPLVVFEVDEQAAPALVPPPPEAVAAPTLSARAHVVLPHTNGASRLNPKYTFDSFVVGSSNQLPHAASLAVTEMVGTKYNPLFVYGGVGLGKTHLVHAIGNTIRARRPGTRVCYLSSEQFMNDFVWALRNDKMDVFHRYFRKEVDVLLMDDIQFIAGKDRTQDEFFHTFNSLYEQKRQIVLTSDKYPQEIPDLEERLRSRFQWGLIADIQPPEFETRLAIVKKKAEDEGIQVLDDVAVFLARSIKSNVRELEGSLINLAAHASLEGRTVIDIEFAQHTLKKVIALAQAPLTVEAVQETVCKHFQVSLDDLRGGCRQRSVAFPRAVAMYLCRKGLSSSLPELGARFGGKDHTTVLAAYRKIEKKVSEEPDTRSRIEALERLLGF